MPFQTHRAYYRQTNKCNTIITLYIIAYLGLLLHTARRKSTFSRSTLNISQTIKYRTIRVLHNSLLTSYNCLQDHGRIGWNTLKYSFCYINYRPRVLCAGRFISLFIRRRRMLPVSLKETQSSYN
jgi:hypothetical protein